MSYLNAPATRQMSSTCCACGRALVDAASVEAGMGPHCRKKYGYNDIPEGDREAANKLIHAIAVGTDNLARVVLLGNLAEIAPTCAASLARYHAAVVIHREGERLSVEAPYLGDLTDAFRAIPGRRWDRDAKRNTFPASQGRELLKALNDCLPGLIATGPKGAFLLSS